MSDGSLDVVFEMQVTTALAKVLHWLGAPSQARKQLWQRYKEWMGGGSDGGAGGGIREFGLAYTQLYDAVLSADREYAAFVLGDAWGIAL
jgi:hypothetical protein